MLYRLVRPVQRKGSSKRQFVQRIPADVKAGLIGRRLTIPVGAATIPLTITAKTEAVRCSLRTGDPSEAKVRQAHIVAYLETVWRAVRSETQPVRFSHQQAVALSREFYEAWASERPGEVSIAVELMPDRSWRVEQEVVLEPEAWDSVMAYLDGKVEAEELEHALGPLLDRVLLNKGIAKVTPESRAMLLTECHRALRDGLANRRRHAEGDYSPDSRAARFPDWSPARSAAMSLTGLVEDWWREAKASGRAQSTYESYRSTIARFAAFVAHDDAAKVKPEDIVAFKDKRLSEGVSPKTVGDSDLAALRAVFGWAVDNLRLPLNPAGKVRVKRSKPIRTRSKGFTADEARAILSHSLNHHPGLEKRKTWAAKRWVPWLCAYTGARVGEIVQLRKQDVREKDGVWLITITPEAGTVKDKEVREVVLHDHLLDLGFPAFVNQSPGGYLFLDPREDGELRGVWRSVKNRLREFAREVVTDSAVAPNHGWRHLFKTIGREAGIADSVLDAICGHAPTSIGGSYGGVTLKAQREAMTRFPRFDVA